MNLYLTLLIFLTSSLYLCDSMHMIPLIDRQKYTNHPRIMSALNRNKSKEHSKLRFKEFDEDKSVVFKARTAERRKVSSTDFYKRELLSDGETEIRISFRGIRAQQTSVGAGEGSPEGLVLAQVTNGHQLLVMIYNGELPSLEDSQTPLEDIPSIEEPKAPNSLTLKDCSVERSPTTIRHFEESFDLRSPSPDLPDAAGGVQVPPSLRYLAAFRSLKKHCRQLHRQRRREQRRANDLKREEKKEDGQNVGFSRARRAINDLFMFPGTLWCGNHHRAKSTQQLSGHLDADACCRVHDFCPYSVPAVSSKYGLFNSGFVTMSHCGCDGRFRTCLKASNTGASKLVGKIFFDMVGTPCFTFRRKKVCHRKDWWGKCQKWRKERRAVIRKPAKWT